MQPFLATIFAFGFNFAPRGWAFCNGQILPIAQNTALFSLLGTAYGGNGQTTFALPDLRGRAPVHFGQGPGLSNVNLGEASGQENVTLIANQLPQHNHIALVNNTAGTVSTPVSGSIFATLTDVNGDGVNLYANGTPNVALHPATVGNTGGSQPHNNMQPYLAMNYSIALAGYFPSRN